MKKLACAAVFAAAALAFSGCTSTGFMGFLATTEGVDAKIAEEDAALREELERQRAQLERVTQDLKNLQDVGEDAAAAAKEAEEARRTVEELKVLIAALQARVEELPDQTLQRIIEILQASLADTEREKK